METIRVGEHTGEFEVLDKIDAAFANGERSCTLRSMGMGVMDLIRLGISLQKRVQGSQLGWNAKLETMPSKKDPSKNVSLPVLEVTLTKA